MLTENQIKATINKIKTRQQQTNDEIHVVLCSIAIHVKEHGDVTLYDGLLDAVKGADRKAITQWIHTFGMATIQKDGTFRLNKKARSEFDQNYDALIEGIRWYEFVPSKREVAKSFDLEKRLISLISQADKFAERAEEEGAEVPEQFDSLLGYVRAAYNKWAADQIATMQ